MKKVLCSGNCGTPVITESNKAFCKHCSKRNEHLSKAIFLEKEIVDLINYVNDRIKRYCNLGIEVNNEDDKDLHTENCCAVHGCKYYRKWECTITSGEKNQSNLCLDAPICNKYSLEFWEDDPIRKLTELSREYSEDIHKIAAEIRKDVYCATRDEVKGRIREGLVTHTMMHGRWVKIIPCDMDKEN